jgi:hypothetical protein
VAFTYSGDPSNSTADYLRFILGDTNEAAPILQDAEINFIILSTESESTASMLALAFRSAANALGAKLVKRSLGPQSEDATKRHEYYVSQADRYERVSKFSGTPPLPVYSVDPIFDKNMMGNEE